MASTPHFHLTSVGNSTDGYEGHRTVDIVYGGVHVFFLSLLALVVFIVRCLSTQLRRFSSKTLIPYPGHKRKWLLTVALSLVLLCAVGEGVLTDVTRNPNTQPHLYLPPSCALLCALMSLVYYHYMEYWNRPSLAWLLLLYWVSSLVVEIVRFLNLIDHVSFDITVLRLDVMGVNIVIYTCLLSLDINVIRTKVFHLCYKEKKYPADLQKKNLLYFFNYTSLLSRAMFSTINWLLVLGYKKPLEISDLGCLPEDFECKNIYEKFEKAYSSEKERATMKNKTPSMWRTYIKAYGVDVFIGVFIKILGDTCALIPALAVGGIVSYATKSYYNEEQTLQNEWYVTVQEFFSNGFVLVIVTFLAVIARGFFIHYGGNICDWVTIYSRTAIQAFVYEKLLHLSSWSLSSGEMTAGQITNHMSVDAMSLHWFSQGHIWLWSVPYQITVILILLYIKMGVSAFIGSLILLFTVPVQLKAAKRLSRIQDIILKISDSRLKKINELLQGIKLLKLYGWEEMFCSSIETDRENQVKKTKTLGVYFSVMRFPAEMTVVFISLITFVTYSLISPIPLTADLVFVTLALINQLTLPMAILPYSLSSLASANSSMKRLEKFFIAQEICDYDNGLPPMSRGYDDIETSEEDDIDMKLDLSQTCTGDGDDSSNLTTTVAESSQSATSNLLDNAVYETYGTLGQETSLINYKQTCLPEHMALKIADGTFAWNEDGSSVVLSNINFQVLTGSLVMVIGLVGSGKSSLLSAILGEMTTIQGSVEFNREKNRIACVPQTAWVQNATLRENILFGQEFDHKRYTQVIEACALQPDIDILPAGDMTEIGEKGINLSGGQKQRVSLARAIYRKTDIVLLDDPLSALDVHVGSHIMEHGIMDMLVREGRTVILVTHQLQYLGSANKVALMENGQISQEGDLNHIKKHDPDLFATWQETIHIITESERESDTDEDLILSADQERIKLHQQIARTEIQKSKGSDGSLIVKEERERGSVSWRVYLAYAKAVKYYRVLLIFTLLAAREAANIIANFLLSAWSELGSNIGNKTQEEFDQQENFYRRAYTLISLLSAIFVAVYVFALALSLISAGGRIHVVLLRNVIHLPLRFFDTTPVGRIMNRFSNDTQMIDQRLLDSYYGFLQTFAIVVSALIVNSIVLPPFIIAMIPILVVYYFVEQYFVATSRELQRLNNITNSPFLAHFSETLGGLLVIRAYRDEKRFRKRLVQTLNTHNLTHLYTLCCFRWLTVRLELLGSIVILLSGLGTLLSCVLGGLQPSLVGLALTYAISICGRINWLVFVFSSVEMQMNAIERVLHYSKIPTEEYRGVYHPPADWPDKGNIEFENVSARYAGNLDPVLHDINVSVDAGEKIGICGRTGSGKSSLTLALFRVIDTFQGRITIDNVDISHVPLLTLRNRLVIIPQDPVLFHGTIRFNLDPDCIKTDEELWEALEIAQLKQIVADLDGQLDSFVSEGGDNFSAGQRQLFCLARAFLRDAKILIMDEATASIDVETDATIQKVISEAFADRTVLTIAHRISTILDSDTVLVMSEGEVVEHGPPRKLQKQGGVFATLVKGHQ